ncbi:DUF4249 domain-containing protein [Portibacter lacus]|nr:DUF4249 domain-containing protein [Portibacter lacus]
MKIFNIIIASLSIFLVTGCEDIIDLELDNTTPRIVIEANLDATHQQIAVIVSKSNDFYEAAEQVKVMNAVVELKGENGETISLNRNDSGIYEGMDLSVQQGEEVTLSVDVDGVNYTAIAKMPSEINLMTVDTMKFNLPFGPAASEESFQMTTSWDDVLGEKNYYRLKSYRDDVYDSGNFSVINDEGLDGNKITQPIRSRFEKGSKVTIELLSTDQAYYDYFLDLDGSQSEGLSSSIPYNAKGNFSNNALGYFGAYYTSAITIQL